MKLSKVCAHLEFKFTKYNHTYYFTLLFVVFSFDKDNGFAHKQLYYSHLLHN